MRKVVLVVLMLLVFAGGWLLWGEAPSHSIDSAQAAVETVTAVRRRASHEGDEEPLLVKRAEKDRAGRDALHRKIVEALAGRERAAPADGRAAPAAGDAWGAKAARKEKTAGAEDEAPTPGGLVDRTGDHGYLVKVMNEDLMPLVDECYALARQAKPELAGELRLNVSMLGDAELGGVVDGVEPGEDNALSDPGLIECVRESLLATTLPAPPHGGREELALFLMLEPEDAGAGAKE